MRLVSRPSPLTRSSRRPSAALRFFTTGPWALRATGAGAASCLGAAACLPPPAAGCLAAAPPPALAGCPRAAAAPVAAVARCCCCCCCPPCCCCCRAWALPSCRAGSGAGGGGEGRVACQPWGQHPAHSPRIATAPSGLPYLGQLRELRGVGTKLRVGTKHAVELLRREKLVVGSSHHLPAHQHRRGQGRAGRRRRARRAGIPPSWQAGWRGPRLHRCTGCTSPLLDLGEQRGQSVFAPATVDFQVESKSTHPLGATPRTWKKRTMGSNRRRRR